MERFIDVNEVGLTLAVAVQGVFILFFIISPIVGSMMAKGVKRRPNSALVLAIMLLIFNLVFVGLTYVLQKAAQDEGLNEAITLSSIAVALLISVLLGWYLIWVMKPPASQIDAELRYYLSRDKASLAPFEEKRLEQLLKYHRRKL